MSQVSIINSHVEKLLAHAQASQGPVVILTGAGISAASGIPTFRGKEGYWVAGSRHYHPMELATRRAFLQEPGHVWSWYLHRWGVCRAAQPNAAHRAVVQCEEALQERFTLITQNVDGLHLRAGNSPQHTYEIHGNIDFMRCGRGCHRQLYPLPQGVSAKQRGEELTAKDKELLRCPQCGEWARPHVLWFDETYDEEYFRFDSSLAAAQRCRLLIVVGTSASTTLPHHVVSLACASGAAVLDINPDRNAFSQLAESAGGAWIEQSAVEALPAVVEHLL